MFLTSSPLDHYVVNQSVLSKCLSHGPARARADAARLGRRVMVDSCNSLSPGILQHINHLDSLAWFRFRPGCLQWV